MRESRCMSLLPRTTLHSDSEHEGLISRQLEDQLMKTADGRADEEKRCSWADLL
jgi:hypothetical protein